MMRKPRLVIAMTLLALVAAACGTSDAATTESTAPSTTDTEVSPVTTATPVEPTEPVAAAPSTTRLPKPPPTTTPPPPTTTTAAPPPIFAHTVSPVTAETVWATWNDECPLHFDDLSLLTLTYWNLDGDAVTGPLIINSKLVDDVIVAFEALFESGFPIERLALVDDYEGDDKAAMRANVTSGFNCRYVDGTERWSNHAFGLAIDINPLINPWAREGNVLPLEGTKYADREIVVPGMINLGDEAIEIFADLGWSWGGVWQSADYMHFSQPGN